MLIVKRDGTQVQFDRDKIINSIMVKTFNEEEANQLLNGGYVL